MGRLDFETETLIPVGGFFDDVTHTLKGEGFDAGEDGTGRGVPLVPSGYTITGTNKTNRVAFETDLAGSLRTKPPRSQENSSSTVVAYSVDTYNQTLHQTLQRGTGTDQIGGVIDPAYGVRRLTPIECERLQGFPDDYTNIPGAKDGPRYKALGNSMAVPVIRWIGDRIERVVKAHALLKAGAA